MAHSWKPVPPAGVDVVDGPLPPVRDVAVGLAGNPASQVWLTERSGQEYVWQLMAVGNYRAAREPANGFSRVAVGPDGTLWAVATSGTFWKRIPSGAWIQANTEATSPLEDVTVQPDGLVWVTGKDGTLWTTTDGSMFIERTVIVGFRRVAGGADNAVWGISSDRSLWQLTPTGWFMASNADFEDVSPNFEGVVWVVRKDGSIATTTDGASFATVPGQGGFESVAAGRDGMSWGTKTDGTLWVWSPDPPHGGGGGGGGTSR
jgi:hypothetical protein